MRAFGCDEEPPVDHSDHLPVAEEVVEWVGIPVAQGQPPSRRGQARISDPRSDVAQLVAPSHLRGTVPFGPVRKHFFVQSYEGAAGEILEGLDLFRAFWVFQLGVAYHGWKTFGVEPWFNWEQIEDLLPLALAGLPDD
jgi:hypothetical protein